MSYTVLFSHKAEKYLKSLQSEMAKHVKEEILTLESALNPKTRLKKIEGVNQKHPLYSYRVGEYRAILTFLKGQFVIVVLEIDNRRTSYRKYQS